MEAKISSDELRPRDHTRAVHLLSVSLVVLCVIDYCSNYHALAFLFAVAVAPVGSFAGGGKKAVAPGLWKLVRLQHHEP